MDEKIPKINDLKLSTDMSFSLYKSKEDFNMVSQFTKLYFQYNLGGFNFRNPIKNIFFAINFTTPKFHHQDKKLVGFIYEDKKENKDNEDLFEISENGNVRKLKPKEIKKEYPEYDGYHKEDKKYLKYENGS